MNAKTWIVVGLPLVGSLALFGCPEKQHAAGTDGAPSAAPSSDPAAAQPTAAGSPGATPSSSAKATVLPRLNLDGSVALLDAATQLLGDAGLPSLPDAALPALPDAGGGGATGVPAECNQYAAQQEVCIGKMAAALQGPARAALAGAKAGWPAAASTPAGRDALLAQCKGLLAAANTCR